MGQLVGPSGQTDRHMSEDDVMNQLRLLMHRARERWRCCTAENDTKTLDLLLVLTLYFHMQSPLPPAAVSGVGNSPFSSLDLHHSDLGGHKHLQMRYYGARYGCSVIIIENCKRMAVQMHVHSFVH